MGSNVYYRVVYYKHVTSSRSCEVEFYLVILKYVTFRYFNHLSIQTNTFHHIQLQTFSRNQYTPL